MRSCRFFVSLAGGLAVLVTGGLVAGAEKEAKAREAVHLRTVQKEFLSLEPILVTAQVEDPAIPGLPAGVGGKEQGDILQFEIKPAVKARSGGKPLPLEAQGGKEGRTRLYDLLEWYQFPAEGSFTVRAMVKHKGGTLASAPVAFTIRKPGKDDAEAGPVDRIHHTPWCNYNTNAFCGDTFDVVKRWPKSKMARYCHYWNGRYSQNKMEYEKAVASYRTVVEQYPDLLLADHAAYGIGECLLAMKKPEDARKQFLALREKLKQRGTAGDKSQSAVQRLVEEALRTGVQSAKK